MASTLRSGSAGWLANDVSRVVALAERQFGVIATPQLRACGVSGSRVQRWVLAGRLHRIAEGVYALGHRSLSVEGHLAAKLLRVGPGAALSHMTAAWWWGLLRFRPGVVAISRVGRNVCVPGVRIHHPASLERRHHRGLPITSPVDTLLAISPIASDAAFRRALAQADHLGLVAMAGLKRETAGRKGCARLHHALDRHLPELAETFSPLEDRFLIFCEQWSLPIPRPNALIAGHQVDAVFEEERVAVELDGRETHGTPAAVVTDRRRELEIRGAGFSLVRYSNEQVTRTPEITARDLASELARARHNPG